MAAGGVFGFLLCSLGLSIEMENWDGDFYWSDEETAGHGFGISDVVSSVNPVLSRPQDFRFTPRISVGLGTPRLG